MGVYYYKLFINIILKYFTIEVGEDYIFLYAY